MKINKKYLLSVFLVLIVALSLSAVSAADDNSSTVLTDDNATSTDTNIEAGTSASDIKGQFDSAAENSTVYFENGTYEFNIDDNAEDNGFAIVINKNLNVVGNGATINAYTNTSGNGLFYVNGTQVNFTGLNIHLINTAENATNNATGYAIYYYGAYDSTVKDSNFYYGNVPVYMSGSTNMTVENSTFTGTTVVMTKNGRESGTKGVNIMGSSDVLIQNNTFYGGLLDGISVAAGSQNCKFDNNNFINNSYGIFFGGGVNYVEVTNSYFENCYGMSISNAKSQANRLIENNTFILKNASTPGIYIETGNTAHGYPTALENFTAQNNVFIANDSSVPTVAIEFDSKSGAFATEGLTLLNNTVTNVTTFFQFVDETAEENQTGTSFNITSAINMTNNPYVPEVTYYNVTGLNTEFAYGLNQQYKVLVTDSNGNVVSNVKVAITLVNSNGNKTYYRTTDENGIARLNIRLYAGNYTMISTYGNTTTNTSITVFREDVNITPISYTVNRGNSFNIKLTGRESNISDVKISIVFQGKKYVRTVKNGLASLKINLKPGTYLVTVYVNSNNRYYSDAVTGTLTVKQ